MNHHITLAHIQARSLLLGLAHREGNIIVFDVKLTDWSINAAIANLMLTRLDAKEFVFGLVDEVEVDRIFYKMLPFVATSSLERLQDWLEGTAIAREVTIAKYSGNAEAGELVGSPERSQLLSAGEA